MEVTELGIVTASNPEQAAKVKCGMSATESGMTIDVKRSHDWKAHASMILTVLGIS